MSGPYIGPRGGKWADPKHTIPWTEENPKARVVRGKSSKGRTWYGVKVGDRVVGKPTTSRDEAHARKDQYNKRQETKRSKETIASHREATHAAVDPGRRTVRDIAQHLGRPEAQVKQDLEALVKQGNLTKEIRTRNQRVTVGDKFGGAASVKIKEAHYSKPEPNLVGSESQGYRHHSDEKILGTIKRAGPTPVSQFRDAFHSTESRSKKRAKEVLDRLVAEGKLQVEYRKKVHAGYHISATDTKVPERVERVAYYSIPNVEKSLIGKFYTGPRGGKYLDPAHKIPWSDLPKRKMRLSGEGHEKIAKLIDSSMKRANDLCAHKPDICKDNLGIERKAMPQIAEKHVDEFLRGLPAKVTTTQEHVGNLKATQREINADKVVKFIKGMKVDTRGPGSKEEWNRRIREPIIVSKDNYVLDGHHRWAALTADNPANKMKVHRVDMGIHDLLKESRKFKHTEFKGLFRVVPMTKAEGGKYIRRVPYRDAKGKRRYRYYYRESAAAREAQAGEEIRLGATLAKVLDVHPGGTVTLQLDGKVQKVSPTQWSKLIAEHYGSRYYDWAEKRSRQTVNAVLRHVPRALLQDLKGTDAERLAELKRRVPDVYARLQKAFDRAGVSPLRAKRMLEATLKRRGWEPEARAVVVGSVIQHRTASYSQLIEASENLAGGKVRAKHVAAAMELVRPAGERTTASHIARTAVSAEAELAKISHLLANAGDDPVKGAQALAETLSAQAVQTLALLAKAYPGLKDKAVERTQKVLLEAPSAAPKRAPTRQGAQGVVYVAGEGGKPQALTARYKLVEAHEVTASHDPTRNFQPHRDYPEGVQERAYHRDVSEQGKVLRNAQTMNPAFVVNTNPDAVNGPPMVTDSGVVLGGNSRAMSMQVAYAQHPEQAAKLRTYLADHAHEVGLKPDDVHALKNPVLVRVVDTPDKSQENMRLLVRQMNESFTQGMDPRTMQVAMGRRIDDRTVQALADSMQPDESLGSFLASPRSKEFVSALFKAGVIDSRNSNQYMVKGTRTLNEDGRTLVSRLLVGRTVGDADMLSNTPQRLMNNLARAVPFMSQAKGHGAGYDLSDDMRVALDAYNDLSNKVDAGTLPALDPKMPEKSFDTLMNYFHVLPGLGETHPVVGNERAKLLLETMIRKPGPVQFSNVFKAYAAKAQANPESQTSMFGPPDPLAMLKQATQGDSSNPAQGGLFAAFRVDGMQKSRPLHSRMKWNGLDVSIENRAGSVRHWTDETTGEKGTTKMLYPYGYVRGSLGADGDHVDVFVGPDENAKNVYVINQLTRPEFKKFDEQKCMLGFNSAAEAKAAYLKHFDDSRFFGSMKAMSVDEFKRKVLKTTESSPLVRSFLVADNV